MAGIAERQVARHEVDEPDKHGDKHAVLVVIAGEGIIDAGADFGGHHALFGQCLKQTGSLSHEQRGGNSLATDVAYTEIKLGSEHHIAVKVATNLAGWYHDGIHVESFVVGEQAGYHRHLDTAGDAQFTLDTLFGRGGRLQLTVGLLQLAVGHRQTLGGPIAEQSKDSNGQQDDGEDNGQCDIFLMSQRVFLLR